ncbi:MAG: CBS domain-containing protein [Thaumarchaeota archaeon]|nr:CBS domain-containing protein [Nitrososphaerota archaeon]
MGLRESLDERVSVYMSTDFVQVRVDASVTDASRVMQKSGATEAVVMRGDTPVGMVTERDILYKVVALGRDPSSVTMSAIMSSPIKTIDEEAKVGEAIAKMSKLGVRRLGVTRNEVLVGLVTQKAMVSGGLQQSIALPELALPGQLACPYCGELVKDKEELSKHIDHSHVGPGLLEGNLSKW